MFYFEINWFNCSHFQLHSCIFLFSVLPPSVKLSLSAHTQGCVPNMTILGVFTLVDIQIHDCKNNNSKWAFRAFKAWVCSSRRLLNNEISLSHYLKLWSFCFWPYHYPKKKKKKEKRVGWGLIFILTLLLILKFQFQSEFDTKSITVTWHYKHPNDTSACI